MCKFSGEGRTHEDALFWTGLGVSVSTLPSHLYFRGDTTIRKGSRYLYSRSSGDANNLFQYSCFPQWHGLLMAAAKGRLHSEVTRTALHTSSRQQLMAGGVWMREPAQKIPFYCSQGSTSKRVDINNFSISALRVYLGKSIWQKTTILSTKHAEGRALVSYRKGKRSARYKCIISFHI